MTFLGDPSNYGDYSANTPFDLTTDITITADPTGAAGATHAQTIRLYGEDAASQNIGLTLTTFSAKIIATGINEISATNKNFSIYPNPVVNTIDFHQTVSNIYIYNTQGALVRSAAQANTLDVSDLANGFYIIKT